MDGTNRVAVAQYLRMSTEHQQYSTPHSIDFTRMQKSSAKLSRSCGGFRRFVCPTRAEFSQRSHVHSTEGHFRCPS